MRYLITGFSGFVSEHFVEYLSAQQGDVKIYGIDTVSPSFKDFKKKGVLFSQLDLLDKKKVKNIILKFKPECILHLASFSSVAFSWENPVLSFNNNTNIFLNLLEAVRESGVRCRVLSVGSSEEYGIVKDKNIPLAETTLLNPISPYAVARVSQEFLSKIYVGGYGLDIVMTRSFNHIGPGQKEIFVVSSFVKQMVQMKKEKKTKRILNVGNVDIVRDFLDVRDVVRAYDLLFKKGKTGEIYNICSGRGMSLREVIHCIADYLKISVDLRIIPSLIRPQDNPMIIGDNRKARSELGWNPEISFKKSIEDVCEYWMEK